MTITLDKDFFLNPARMAAFEKTLLETGNLHDACAASGCTEDKTRPGFFRAIDWSGNDAGEFDTRKRAEDWIREKFAEYCEDWCEIGDGKTIEDEAYVIEEDEDMNEIARHKIELSYTGERSDYEEHNTMYRGGCI